MLKKLVVLIAILAALGGVGVWQWSARANPTANFRTAPVTQGRLQVNIGATGTIVPEEVIDVGAQVAGRIVTFGQDPRDSSKTIDYGSEVEEGTVLARLDPSVYLARRDAAKADLLKAKA